MSARKQIVGWRVLLISAIPVVIYSSFVFVQPDFGSLALCLRFGAVFCRVRQTTLSRNGRGWSDSHACRMVLLLKNFKGREFDFESVRRPAGSGYNVAQSKSPSVPDGCSDEGLPGPQAS